MKNEYNTANPLRLVSTGDAVSLFALTEKDRIRLGRWLPWVEKTKTLKDMKGFVSRVTKEKEKRESIHFVVLDQGEVSGIAGAHRIDEKEKIAEIGYWLREESEGKGLVTNSCRYLIKELFESYKVETIEIRTNPENERSKKVALRLGFTEPKSDDSSEKTFITTRKIYLANQAPQTTATSRRV